MTTRYFHDDQGDQAGRNEITLDGITFRRDEIGMWQSVTGFYPGLLLSEALDEIERLRGADHA